MKSGNVARGRAAAASYDARPAPADVAAADLTGPAASDDDDDGSVWDPDQDRFMVARQQQVPAQPPASARQPQAAASSAPAASAAASAVTTRSRAKVPVTAAVVPVAAGVSAPATPARAQQQQGGVTAVRPVRPVAVTPQVSAGAAAPVPSASSHRDDDASVIAVPDQYASNNIRQQQQGSSAASQRPVVLPVRPGHVTKSVPAVAPVLPAQPATRQQPAIATPVAAPQAVRQPSHNDHDGADEEEDDGDRDTGFGGTSVSAGSNMYEDFTDGGRPSLSGSDAGGGAAGNGAGAAALQPQHQQLPRTPDRSKQRQQRQQYQQEVDHGATTVSQDGNGHDIDANDASSACGAMGDTMSSVSPCGGSVVYGIPSEDVNPGGSVTMEIPSQSSSNRRPLMVSSPSGTVSTMSAPAASTASIGAPAGAGSLIAAAVGPGAAMVASGGAGGMNSGSAIGAASPYRRVTAQRRAARAQQFNRLPRIESVRYNNGSNRAGGPGQANRFDEGGDCYSSSSDDDDDDIDGTGAGVNDDDDDEPDDDGAADSNVRLQLQQPPPTLHRAQSTRFTMAHMPASSSAPAGKTGVPAPPASVINDTDTEAGYSSSVLTAAESAKIARKQREPMRRSRYGAAVAAAVARYGALDAAAIDNATTTDGDTTEADTAAAMQSRQQQRSRLQRDKSGRSILRAAVAGAASASATAATAQAAVPSSAAAVVASAASTAMQQQAASTPSSRSPPPSSLRQRHTARKTPADNASNMMTSPPRMQPLGDVTNTAAAASQDAPMSTAAGSENAVPSSNAASSAAGGRSGISKGKSSRAVGQSSRTLIASPGPAVQPAQPASASSQQQPPQTQASTVASNGEAQFDASGPLHLGPMDDSHHGRPSDSAASDAAQASHRRSSASAVGSTGLGDIRGIDEDEDETPLAHIEIPVPEPLFNMKARRGKDAYRPSTSLNEDDYDFAIVVRAVVTPKQEAALAKAKAQADQIAAAAARDHGNGVGRQYGYGSNMDMMMMLQSPDGRGGLGSSMRLGGTMRSVHASRHLNAKGSDLSNTTGSSAAWNSSRSLQGPIGSSSRNMQKGVIGGPASALAMPTVIEVEDDENLQPNHGGGDCESDTDSASESDSDSGSASEDEYGPGNEANGGNGAAGYSREDEAWYDEWDAGSDDDEADDDDADVAVAGARSKSDPAATPKRKKKKQQGKGARRAGGGGADKDRRSAGVIAAIVGIAERGISRVRKSLGGHVDRSQQHQNRSGSKTRGTAADGATSGGEGQGQSGKQAGGGGGDRRRVQFGRLPHGNDSEAVITVLPRSPIPVGTPARNNNSSSNANISSAARENANRMLSPTLSAVLAMTPNGHDDEEGDDDGRGEVVGVRVHKCAEILAALYAAGLQAKRFRSLSRRTWLIKIKCPEWRLEIEAQKLRLRMRRVDGGWSKFRRSQRATFVPAIPLDEDELQAAEDEDDAVTAGAASSLSGGNPGSVGGDIEAGNAAGTAPAVAAPSSKPLRSPKARPSLFHSSDRQTLIDHILRSSSREGGAELGDASPLGAYVTHMFPLHMHARLEELRSDWLNVWRPERSHGDRDRIGVVDEAWYAAPHLVDINAVSAASSGSAGAGAGAAGRSQGWFSWLLPGSSNAKHDEKHQHDTGATAAKLPPTSGFDKQHQQQPQDPGSGEGGDHDHRDSNGKLVKQHRQLGRVASCCARVCSSTAMRWCCSLLLVRLVYTLMIAVGKFGRSITRFGSRLMVQPLDRIAAYFGETIAFYFAWLEFYTRWLVLPAIIGIFLFLGQLYYGGIDMVYVPLFSLTTALWSILFLECWKRRNAELAQRWGVLHYEDEEAVRPQFAGVWKQDAETGEVLRIYPRWRRALKYAVTVPLLLSFVIGMVLLMVFVYSVRDHVLLQYNRHKLAVLTQEAIMGNATLAAEVAAGTLTLPPDVDIDLGQSIQAAWSGGLWGFLSGDASMGDPSDFSSGTGTSASGGGRPFTSLSDAFRIDFSAISATDLARFEGFFSSQGDWKWWCVMTLPPILLGILMPLIDLLFGRIALAFNGWENHATESQYRNMRIAKVFFFRFTLSFIPLFYYAFSPKHSLTQLAVQLGTYMTVTQLWHSLLEAVGPRCCRQIREFKFKRRLHHAEESGLTEGRRGRRLFRHAQSEAWKESRMPRYDSFNDYAEMLIQFGYVTFFSWAFPLAPAFALIKNVFEMRADAYKLCHNTQRPIAHKAGGIGVWYNVLVAMSLLAVLTNCAHLALVSRQFDVYFPGLTESQKMLVVFVFEHLVLSLRLVMPYLVPPTPERVKRRIQRDNFALARLQGRRSLGNQ